MEDGAARGRSGGRSGYLRAAALWLLVLSGGTSAAVFGSCALGDWAALQTAYARFEEVARASPTLPALYLAESRQNVHRLNLFAEGVWTLLAAILAGIGPHGLCAPARRNG